MKTGGSGRHVLRQKIRAWRLWAKRSRVPLHPIAKTVWLEKALRTRSVVGCVLRQKIQAIGVAAPVETLTRFATRDEKKVRET
jgi:hypothetical protein